MQFETESAAKRFIQFNGADITDKPEHLRVYYCPACCCYHITSKKENRWYKRNTDRLLEAYNSVKQTRKNVKSMTQKTKEKVEIVERITEIVKLEPTIQIDRTGERHIVAFDVSSKEIRGLDMYHNKFDLYLFNIDVLTSMLKKLCLAHYKLKPEEVYEKATN